MNSTKLLLLPLIAVSVVAVSEAQAGEAPSISVQDAPEYVPAETGSGWYLRGDIGYALSRDASPFYRAYDSGTGTYGAGSYTSGGIGNDAIVSAGIGYRFSDWLRTDATLERFTGGFDGSTQNSLTCAGTAGTTGCRSVDTSDFTAYALMLNAYADLGTFAGFTPYLGGGLGYTHVDWGALNSGYYCVDGSGSCASYGLASTSSNAGTGSWRFSYALMAGVAYDISPKVKIDFGYKFRHVGSGGMFAWDASAAGAGATGAQGSDGGISSHELTVGLRVHAW
jgi:opacity protein-like surface antigen